MNPHVDTETVFFEAKPDGAPPKTILDLKKVIRDGHRARRRNRAAIGAAAATGVCTVAAVLALSVAGPPSANVEQQYPAGEGFAFDPTQAGYPSPADGDWDVNQPHLQEAATRVLGDLAVDADFLEADAFDYDLPSEEAVEAAMDDYDLGYYEALSELGYNDLPLQFGPWNSPGNGGQVHLRGYIALDGSEAEQSSFTVTAFQPGGWTAEPGPTGDVAFPQHLISNEASWSGEVPAFTTEELDDGRTLMVADHGCALEAAIVYPNGSALRSTWNLDCEGQGRDMTVEELSAAMLEMPQIDYDISELQPLEDLLDFPSGWTYDEGWAAAAAADAQASVEAATSVLDSAHPGVELASSQPIQLELSDTVQRTYGADFYMPFDDAAGNPVSFFVRYYLPGGWLPGLAPEGSGAEVYLFDCTSPDDVCEETQVDGRTVATQTSAVGENVSTRVVAYDSAGWAVSFDTMTEGELDEYALEDLVALTASLPAPVYDAEEYER